MPRKKRNLNGTARLLPGWSIRCGRGSLSPIDARFGAVLSDRPVQQEYRQVDVRVAGHQVDTGETLRDHAQRRVGEITEKYFSRSVGANVTFGRGPNNDYTCDIVAPVVNGVVLKASYSGREPEIAFNGAADRIEKQLRRYTNRLKEHKVEEAESEPFIENAAYTIFAGSQRQEGESDQRSYPAIVAETRVD